MARLNAAPFLRLESRWIGGRKHFLSRSALVTVACARTTAAGAAASALVVLFVPNHLGDDRREHRDDRKAYQKRRPVER